LSVAALSIRGRRFDGHAPCAGQHRQTVGQGRLNRLKSEWFGLHVSIKRAA